MKRLAICAAMVGLSPFFAAPAYADGTPECNDGALANTLECGTNSNVGSATLATAIGPNADATDVAATAVGSDANATGSFSTALGEGSQASAFQASALGAGTNAAGQGAVAVGAVSHALTAESVAVGHASIAGGNNSIAIGAVASAAADGAVAIGIGATVTGSSSVALGAGSSAEQDNTVSVGLVGSERRIVNVASGTVSATSTDAVNGSQLHATNQVVADHETRITALEQLVGDVGGLQNSVNNLFDLRRVDRRDMKQGVAAAMAMADAPMPSRPGGLSYQVKAGTFRGEHAVSGAMTYRLNTRSPMAVSASVSYAGNKNNGATVALSGEF